MDEGKVVVVFQDGEERVEVVSTSRVYLNERSRSSEVKADTSDLSTDWHGSRFLNDECLAVVPGQPSVVYDADRPRPYRRFMSA